MKKMILLVLVLLVTWCGYNVVDTKVVSWHDVGHNHYLETEAGVFKVAGDPSEHWAMDNPQDLYALKENVLRFGDGGVKLTKCGHGLVVRADPLTKPKEKTEPKRTIIYYQVTPSGIAISAWASALAGCTSTILGFCFILWLGYRLGRAS